MIGKITFKNSSLRLYETLEISTKVVPEPGRSYDPDRIDFSLLVTKPDGTQERCFGYFDKGPDLWKARYTTTSKGLHTFTVIAKTQHKEDVSSKMSFNVTESKCDGFIRLSTNNPYYLVHDSGKPFYGIGHNIAWVADNDISIYKRYFAKLSESGCNFTRIWINCEWTLNIETRSLGSYNLPDSKKIDRLLKAAKEYGVYIILVLDSYGSLMKERGTWNEGVWHKNPYNSDRGGPCKDPKDFFISNHARSLYKKRLKYIFSRWGYSPNILAFEFWNETNVPIDWLEEMSDYVRSINIHGQLLTTSFPSSGISTK